MPWFGPNGSGMVASDTVVGLVGAGILLVALVGVFIVESRDSSEEATLEQVSHATNVGGTIEFSRRGGDRLPLTGGCSPAPGNVCTEDWTNSTGLTLKGVDAIEPPLHYVAWLTKANGASPERLGAFSLSGADYRLTFTIPKNLRDWNELHVTLETKAEPSALSPLMVNMATLSIGSENRASVSVASAFDAVYGTGTCDATFNDVASGLQVDVKLDQAYNYTGLQYRAWLVKEDSRPDESAYVFLGNLTAKGSLINATVTKGVADLTLGDFSEVMVTLEHESVDPAADDAKPKGVLAFRGDVP